ncbi:hypothetical protein AAAC51_06980 [Priestia megaterium]
MIEAPVKIRVKDITITRVEGMRDECNTPHTVHSWMDADFLLNKMATTSPEPGTGIHKVDYHVEFEDGEVYKGTYALDKDDKVFASLLGHTQRTIQYHAGLWKPSWISKEQYEKTTFTQNKQEAKEFLVKYLAS